MRPYLTPRMDHTTTRFHSKGGWGWGVEGKEGGQESSWHHHG